MYPDYIFGETDAPLISLPAAAPPQLLIQPTIIDTTFLAPQPSFPPYSPTCSESSAYSSSSSASCSSNCSDNEDFTIQMDQLDNVKRLLRMFPPPMTAEGFIERNSFKAVDGHIKRPSNNFILFRKIAHDQKSQTPDLSDYNEREFSKIIGKIWKGLTPDEKTTYEKLGKEVAELHKALHPEYKYQPKRDKAAWKHFNPESTNSNHKARRKSKVKQQKHQETTTEISKTSVNIPQQQQQQQQQPPIIQDNSLEYSLQLSEEMYFQPYPEANNAYAANNTYANNTYTFDNLFSVTPEYWNM